MKYQLIYSVYMLDYEYKKLQEAKEPRSCLLTIICLVCSSLALVGIITVLKYVGHEGVIIFSVIIPTTIVFLILLFAGLNGRKSYIKNMIEVLFLGFPWWS